MDIQNPIRAGEIEESLGSDWDIDFDRNPLMVGDAIHSAFCIARRRSGKKLLIVEVSIDRMATTIRVGTSPQGDLYPFEDVAIHYGWRTVKDMRDLLKSDGLDALVELPEALRLIAANVDTLEDDFKRGKKRLRNSLAKIADKFHNDAWGDGDKGRKQTLDL